MMHTELKEVSALEWHLPSLLDVNAGSVDGWSMSAPDGGSQRSLREMNRRRVIAALRAAGTLTQAELARTTGLSAASVSGIVRDLTADGLLRTAPTVSSGRRAQAVSLNPGGRVVAGIDFGRTHVRVAVADLAHTFLGEREVEVDHGVTASKAIAAGARLFRELLDETGIDPRSVIAAGAGVPGPIHSSSGVVESGAILPEWVGVRAADAIQQAVEVPVTVDNDANLGALAEVTWGSGRGVDDLIYIKLETGIGAGLVLGGRLHRGSIGMAGEIGHMSMDEEGAVCRCGNRGCLETMASAPVVLELLSRRYGPGLTIDGVARRAVDGDAAFVRVIGDAGRHVGRALAHLCNLVNPALVVVDGQLVAASEVLLEPMRDALARYSIPAIGATTQVVASKLGRRSPVMGAVALALRAADAPAPG